MFSPFYAVPLKSFIAEMILLQRPELFDILPMYILFLIFTPLVIILLHKGKSYLILILSILIWLLGQKINPFMTLIQNYFPKCNSGFFNMFAWQFIFYFGVFLGFRNYHNKQYKILQQNSIITVALICFFILFLSRHEFIHLGIDIIKAANRENLAWLRLLNFLLLTAILGYIFSKIPKSKNIKWLAFLGKHSLQVFSYHILIFYFLLPINPLIIKNWGELGYVIYVLLIVISLSIPALIHRASASIQLNWKKAGSLNNKQAC